MTSSSCGSAVRYLAIAVGFLVLFAVLFFSVVSIAPTIHHALFPGAAGACSIPTGVVQASAYTGIATSVLGLAGLTYAANKQRKGTEVFNGLNSGWTEGMAKWALLFVILAGLALVFANIVTIFPGFLSSSLLMPGTAAFITIFACGGVVTLGGASFLEYRARTEFASDAEMIATLQKKNELIFTNPDGSPKDENEIRRLVKEARIKDAEQKKAAKKEAKAKKGKGADEKSSLDQQTENSPDGKPSGADPKLTTTNVVTLRRRCLVLRRLYATIMQADA